MPKQGPLALKQAIHVARARAGVTSDMQLALRAHVSYDTLMNWYSGRTTPRPNELKKVAVALGTSYGDLMAAYEGRDPEPQPLQDAVRDLTGAVRELVTEMKHDHERDQAVLSELRSFVAANLPEEPKPSQRPTPNHSG